MKKRLRKKLRLQEFQQLGFHVYFDFADDSPSAYNWQFFDRANPAAEASGLHLAGALNSFYAKATGNGSVTESQRQKLVDWLVQQPEVANLVVAPLSDAWYVSAVEWTDMLPDELLGRPGLNA